MRQPHLAEHKVCTGCMACVDSCNQHALKSYVGEDGHYYVKVDESKCIGCLLCEKTCPIVNELDYGESECADFYAAWNKNKEERLRSASGGAFSAMAHYVLDHGGVVIGAAIENICDVRHIVVSDINNLSQLQGSKYTQSNTTGVYKKAFQLLKEGKTVLFSGIGCQVAGLLSYIGNKHYDGRLITVDLICGGVPSKRLIQKFIDNEPYQIKKIQSFRTKDTGWMPRGFVYNLKVQDVDGNIHDYIGKNNLITTGFSKELTNRYSCYNCKFVGTHRLSDFTIGDLWGDKKYPQEHYNGISLIIAHNQKAPELLKEMAPFIQTFPYDYKLAVKSNYRIVDGKNVLGCLWERKYLATLFRRCSYSLLKKIYANDYPNYSPWVILKVIRKVFVIFIKVGKKARMN